MNTNRKQNSRTAGIGERIHDLIILVCEFDYQCFQKEGLTTVNEWGWEGKNSKTAVLIIHRITSPWNHARLRQVTDLHQLLSSLQAASKQKTCCEDSCNGGIKLFNNWLSFYFKTLKSTAPAWADTIKQQHPRKDINCLNLMRESLVGKNKKSSVRRIKKCVF